MERTEKETMQGMNNPTNEFTQALEELSQGHAAKADELMPLVYDQLRALAANLMGSPNPAATLQPTALVNEAYLKLVDQSRVRWQGKSHFFAIGATLMRRILVDYARRKNAEKRGGNLHRVEVQEIPELSIQSFDDVLAVDEALEKLQTVDPLQAKIVELRFFGGLTVADVAEVVGVSKRKVEYEWAMVRAWLRRELGDEGCQ